MIICKGFDVVCVFVNDDLSVFIFVILVNLKVKYVVLCCVGFNNVDVYVVKVLGI